MPGSPERRGLTLLEVVVFTALGLMLGRMAMDLYTRSVAMSDATHRAVAVQQGVRAVVELLRRDMHETLVVGDTGETERHRHVVLYTFASAGPEARLTLNDVNGSRRDYPFWRGPGEAVTNKLDGRRVEYRWDLTTQQVRRTEQAGTIGFTADPNRGHLVTGTSFEGSGPVQQRIIASNVKVFDLRYFGYERRRTEGPGALKRVQDLRHLDGFDASVRVAHTACLLLRVNAVFDEGLYAGGGRQAPEAEILTKIWSNTRLRDEVYHQYFSSIDWDLRY